jgi:hypothetical protein
MEAASIERLREMCDPDTSLKAEFSQLIAAARKGDKPAKIALYEWGMLAVSGATGVPSPLREYIADELFELAENSRRKRGKNPDESVPRDFDDHIRGGPRERTRIHSDPHPKSHRVRLFHSC